MRVETTVPVIEVGVAAPAGFRREAVSFERCRPLRALSGSGIDDRFRLWTGRSGQRYVFSVFPLPTDRSEEVEILGEAVVIGVERRPDDTPIIRFVAQTGPLPDPLVTSEKVSALRAVPGGELHLHLTARDAEERRGIVADLRAA